MRPLLFLLLLSLAACQDSPPSPYDSHEYAKVKHYQIYGVDISKYQERLDWDKMKLDSIRFVFMKATQGSTGKDPYFDANWQAAQNADIMRGAYHFFENTDTIGAIKQARFFINTVKMEEGDLPPVLDIEKKPFNKKHLQAAKKWLNLVERHYGVRPIVYSSQHFYNKYLSKELKDYPLWIAKYSNSPPTLKGGKQWLFWQYTDQQRNIFSKNKSGTIDLNAFYGNRGDLEELRKYRD